MHIFNIIVILGSVKWPLSYKYKFTAHVITPLRVPNSLHFVKIKSAYMKRIKSDDVLGIVQHHILLIFSMRLHNEN